ARACESGREARGAEDRPERLRLYYVAMTRAIDRLIVSGAIDPESKADAATPLGWVLGRLDAGEGIARAGRAPIELERDDARLLIRVDRFLTEEAAQEAAELPESAEDGQLELFAANGGGEIPPAPPTLPA